MPSKLERFYCWACELIYHELAWAYDLISWLVSFGRWHRWQMVALDYLVGTNILELGFGTGTLMSQILQRGYQIVGIDLSPQMQQVAKAKMARRGQSFSGVLAKGQNLPFPAAQFHTIVATFPASYILTPETLSECVRVLKQPAGPKSTYQQNLPGRLVIVGAWVSLQRSWLQNLIPLFYGEPDAQQKESLIKQLYAAGLSARFVSVVDAWAEVSVIVAELRSWELQGGQYGEE
ncbi:MAG: class I SAM-dependent methyltransferase [Chloroflexota bacterium]